MKRCTLFALILLYAVPVLAQESDTLLNVFYGPIPEGNRTFFVALDGNDTNVGTEEEPWGTLEHAISQVTRGDVIVMRGGVYEYDDTITIQTPSGFTDQLIVLTAYPGEVPILDFSSQPKERNYHGIRLNANWWHIIGITVRNASHNGIRMDGSYNILEQVTAYGNHDTGIHMAGGASFNLIKNCDSFHNFNYDLNRTPRIGNNADGFSAKFEIGPGNRYLGCRAWENSDDGFDFWEATGTIVIDSSWAFGNGNAEVFGNPENFEGNGNGFKLGGNHVRGDHIVTRSLAFDNVGSSGNAKGFDYNNNPGAMTLIHNTAYNNPRNFVFPLDPPDGQTVFLNNLSVKTRLDAQTPPGAVVAGNSWQYETEVTEDMFLSVDTAPAKSPRERDGSLPEIDLLKPVEGNFIVDGGVILTEPFYGQAPDIGVHELVTSPGSITVPWITRGSGTLVTNLVVSDLENASAWAIQSALNAGADAFGDTSYTITRLPADILVEEWIQTAAGSGAKNYLFPAAEFELGQMKNIYIAHSDEIEEKPEWLSTYEETASTLTLTDPDGVEHVMTLFRRVVEAGEVIALGRNSTDGGEAPMYLVLVGSSSSVAVEDDPGLAAKGLSLGVYPNPVRRSVTLSYTLTRVAEVTIGIYDTMGREVTRVAEGWQESGVHELMWDVQALPSGVYYCRLIADGASTVKMLVKVK